MTSLIPNNYSEWKYCITEICRIPLTQKFIEQRLQALNNFDDHMTAGFIKLYGEEQRQKTLTWLDQAAKEIQQ